LFDYSTTIKPFVTESRKLLREGAMTMNNIKKYVFLLSDMILVTTPAKSSKRRTKYNFVQQMMLDEVELFDYSVEKGLFVWPCRESRLHSRPILAARTGTDPHALPLLLLRLHVAPAPTILIRTKSVQRNCTFDDAATKGFWLTALEQAVGKPSVVLNCHPMAL
jgi:hypothetical protein